MDEKRIFTIILVLVLVVASCTLIGVMVGGSASCSGDYSPKPLIIVSLDGFRADYESRGLTPTLSRLAEEGVHTPYMKASYPTITFPNHYSIVTGLYPESHGIIANSFYDSEFNESFSMSSNNGKWWGGDPIWNTVTAQGKKSATFFWPGSDVPINGKQPTYWLPYSDVDKYSFNDRVDQVLEWLLLDEKLRPDWISLYLDEPDHTAHDSGPDSFEVDAMLDLVDGVVNRLVTGLAMHGLTSCVNLIVVADHGMAAAGPARILNLTEFVPDLTSTAYTYSGAFSRIRPKDPTEVQHMVDQLACKNDSLRAYERRGLPTRLHFANNIRIEDIVLDLDPGYTTTKKDTPKWIGRGQHGYDNYNYQMNALFLASGPDFKKNLQIEPFQNIELYNLMCLLVGVEPSPNNGTLGSLYHILANPPSPLPQLPQVDEPVIAQRPDDSATEMFNQSNCNPSSEALARCSDLVPESETEAQQNITEAAHAPWGLPQCDPDPSNLTLLYHNDHITGYSQALRLPLWTSYTVDNKLKLVNNTSTAWWCSDVRLDPTTTATCDQYQAANLSMLPLFPNNMYTGATDLVSNAVPVSGEQLLHWVRLHLVIIPGWRECMAPLNLVLGPVFDHNADGRPDNTTHTINDLVVPSDLFTVVTRCRTQVTDLTKCATSDLDAQAFIFPVDKLDSNCLAETKYAQEFSAKLRDVELVTGLTLFPNLDFYTRTALMLRIHSRIWPLHFC